jgi:hypothetical protein
MTSFDFAQPVIRPCSVCGWTTMPGFDLCVGCLDIREWSRLNRAFCDFLHRTIVPPCPAPEWLAPTVWAGMIDPEPADSALELAEATAD